MSGTRLELKTAKITKQWDDRSQKEQYSNNEWYVYKEKKEVTFKTSGI